MNAEVRDNDPLEGRLKTMYAELGDDANRTVDVDAALTRVTSRRRRIDRRWFVLPVVAAGAAAAAWGLFALADDDETTLEIENDPVATQPSTPVTEAPPPTDAPAPTQPDAAPPTESVPAQSVALVEVTDGEPLFTPPQQWNPTPEEAIRADNVAAGLDGYVGDCAQVTAPSDTETCSLLAERTTDVVSRFHVLVTSDPAVDERVDNGDGTFELPGTDSGGFVLVSELDGTYAVTGSVTLGAGINVSPEGVVTTEGLEGTSGPIFEPVTPQAGMVEPTALPDSRVVFAVIEENCAYSTQLAYVNGDAEGQVDKIGETTQPLLSPSGRYLAYSNVGVADEEACSLEVVVEDLFTGERWTTTAGEFTDSRTPEAWHPSEDVLAVDIGSNDYSGSTMIDMRAQPTEYPFELNPSQTEALRTAVVDGLIQLGTIDRETAENAFYLSDSEDWTAEGRLRVWVGTLAELNGGGSLGYAYRNLDGSLSEITVG